MNELLVTSADFQNIAQIPSNLDFNRLVPSILKAQRGPIRDAIGKAQYRDLHVNQTASKYTALLDGGTMEEGGETIDFFGLKQAICMYAYAFFIADNSTRVTRAGNVVKTSEVSDPASPEQVMAEQVKAMQIAEAYLAEAAEFLRQNPSDYPLFQQGITAGANRVGSLRKSQYDTEYPYLNNRYSHGYPNSYEIR